MENGLNSWSIIFFGLLIFKHSSQLPPIRYSSKLNTALAFEAHDAMTSQPKRLLPGDGVWLFGAEMLTFLTPWLNMK